MPTRTSIAGTFAQRRGGVVADRHHHRQRHAALAGRAERGAGEVVDHLVEVGVGQHDAMAFLAPPNACGPRFPVGGAARVDAGSGDVGRSS